MLAVSTLHQNVAAQAPPETTENEKQKVIFELSKSLADYFARISALSFKSSLQYSINPKFAVVGNLDFTKGPQTGTFVMELRGNKYRIDDRTNTGSQAEQFHQLIAYNGETYQVLKYSDHLLWIKALRPSDQKPLADGSRFSDFFLQTFEFLSTSLTEDYESALDFAEFKTDDCAAAFAKRITSVKLPAEPGGKVTVSVAAGADAFSKLPVLYIVDFSTSEGYFPTNWRRVDILNRTLATLDVSQTAVFIDPAGKRFEYPKKIRYANYGGDSTNPIQEVPVFTKTVEVTDFKVNSPGESRDPFTIDPALADAIFDADQQKLIKVPRQTPER